MKIRAMVILGLLLVAAGCKERCSRSYHFDQPVSVYPVKEAYHIGDTLWVDMHFPDVFDAEVYQDGQGEFHESVQLKNFDFRIIGMRMFKLQYKTIPLISQEYSWDAFTSIHVLGDIQWEGMKGMEYKLIYSNGMYSMKIGLVCNEVGTYLLSPYFEQYYSGSLYRSNQQDITPECENEVITDIRFPVNRQPDGTYLTNYHLFEQSMDTTLENDLERIRTASFTFEVK